MATALAKQDTAAVTDMPAFRYADLYRSSIPDRIRTIRAGVPARMLKRLILELYLDQAVVFHALSLKTATVNRKAAQDELLSVEDSERVIGLARLVGQIETMMTDSGVSESGDTDGFDAAAWLSRWLGERLPALGGERPIDLLDTMEGQALVSRTLAQIQTGAYA